MGKSNLIIKPIDLLKSEGAIDLLVKYHYLHVDGRASIPTTKEVYGLYRVDNPNTILGVCIYASPTASCLEYSLFKDCPVFFCRSSSLELRRLVLHPDIQASEHNITSWFVSRTIRLIKQTRKYKYIISYASTQFHIGTIYMALNFKFYGLGGTGAHHFFKSKTGKKGTFQKVKRQYKQANQEGVYYYKQKDFRKLRFIYWLDDSEYKRCLWKEVKWTSQYASNIIEQDRSKIAEENNPIVYYKDQNGNVHPFKRLNEIGD